ncbi:MAG: toll/interleukin-1 receptor domain-containing protein [Xenococcus sp. MO_188.B8]|nr:toll/interleukin-1 receptor domain-containing protein [Xenococcus sp. MO_188.B8]
MVNQKAHELLGTFGELINIQTTPINKEQKDKSSVKKTAETMQKVFISHSSKDKAFVEELVELLELIGLPEESIFCTSLDGYGIDIGENFLDTIKEKLNNNTLVIFLLTQNFYSSPVCLCEMGATWVQTKNHIPIIVPPFDFADIKGVIPLTQGFKVNDKLKLNIFKEKIESVFGIQSALEQNRWERKRDRIIARINEKIPAVT